MPDALLEDAIYVSRYGSAVFGVEVFRDGEVGLADLDHMDVRLSTAAGTLVATGEAERDTEGRYAYRLTSVRTAEPGRYLLRFLWEVDGDPHEYAYEIEVGLSAPAYDVLPDGWKAVVETVWARFADLYDSRYGGPYLQNLMQTRFNRNRLAQLLHEALGDLNTVSQPQTTYTLSADFPFAQWGALVEKALYIAVVKHLIRSYTEEPEVVLGTVISRVDRRDYQQRWLTILEMEQPDYVKQRDQFKMAHMGLGNVSVLVSGGAFGYFGPTMTTGGVGAAAARGYYFVRRHF